AAASRCLASSKRATHLDRLARHDRGRRVTDMHRVRVHHPGHHALVRIHVGRRNIRVRSERLDDSIRVAPSQALELANAHLERITDYATLRATERNVHDRALPRHPRGERLHFLERDVHVEANAALARAARRVVEHAVTGEDLDLSVVQNDRARHGYLLLRIAKNLVDARLQVEQLGGTVKTRHHRVEWIFLVQNRVLVRVDDFMSRKTVIGGHYSAIEVARLNKFARADATRECPSVRRTACERYQSSTPFAGQTLVSFTASFSVVTTYL